jgi:hypothetical protein
MPVDGLDSADTQGLIDAEAGFLEGLVTAAEGVSGADLIALRALMCAGRSPRRSFDPPPLVFLPLKPRQGRVNGIQSPPPGLEKKQETGFRASVHPGLAAGAGAQSCLRHGGRSRAV